jgi:hypothetical protein
MKFELPFKRGIKDHFKEGFMCLGIPRATDLVPPLGTIVL